jgi:hypothetical protein
MRCFFILCPKTHKDGWRLFRNNDGEWSCWSHLTQDEKDRITRFNPNAARAERPAMTGNEILQDDIKRINDAKRTDN